MGLQKYILCAGRTCCCNDIDPLIPDWKVCIVQPISQLRNFGTSARPDVQILKILLSDAQFENAVRRKNYIMQLFRAARGKMYYAIFATP